MTEPDVRLSVMWFLNSGVRGRLDLGNTYMQVIKSTNDNSHCYYPLVHAQRNFYR